ncbi:hypothetical protein, partial [Falsiroseomonas oryziterrae]|uniref:hypothetical protein n=1 Tax=Falsiroseomonas oryziterrae TaxID=2911368 RepID=UPI001F2BF654
MIRLLAAALVALPLAAQAQAPAAGPAPAGVPDALRGAWFAGDCADPQAMLVLTSRAAARVDAEEPGRLYRFSALREAAGYTLGTAVGA